MTSLRDVARVGKQTPTLALIPEAVTNDAEDAAFLASSYGLTPDEWQDLVLRAWLGRRPDGKWAASRNGLAVARQNGKNGILEIAELYKMVGLRRRILHTAHEVKTCRKAFIRLAGFFENERQFPELAALVKEIRRTNGQEAIILANGGSCEFIARSRNSGRGFTVDDLVMDEAQELTDDALAALLPTISAAPSGDPQVTMVGTPPAPSNNGDVFLRTRIAGLEGKDDRLCWLEWSNEPGVDLDDPDVIAAANPALGIRLSWETVADERAAMDDETFGRERAGIWGGGAGASVIDPDAWAGLEDPSSQPGDPVAFGIDVTPDRKTASIAVAGVRPDGRKHVEIVPCCRFHDRNGGQCGGTAWVVKRVLELDQRWKPQAWLLDPAGPAGSLITGLSKEKIEPALVAAREMAQACGEFYDAVVEGQLRHLGQPELNAAIGGARKRNLADAWAWHRRDAAVNISPLVAATLALHGVDRRPKRRRKTGRATFL